MCATCGCGEDEQQVTITIPGKDNEHIHISNGGHSHSHSHEHGTGNGKKHNHEHDHSHSHEHGDGHQCQHEHGHSHEHGDGHQCQHEHGHNHEHGDGHQCQHEHEHSHEHKHEARHQMQNVPESKQSKTISIEQDVLLQNNIIAQSNRKMFESKNIFAINLVSSPGSGKTSLLEKTIMDLGENLKCFIIEGDQQTMNDAERIRKAGAPVIQINTGNGCHLDANMINVAFNKLEPQDNSVLFIENVGNLVCPAMFDLGEAKRVVVISTTEGEDKPLKYPAMFETSDVCIINKTDLMPYLDFNIEKCKEYAMRVNHNLEFFEISVKTGEGMDKWYSWLSKQ